MKGFTSFAAAFIGTLAGAQQVGTDIVWEKDLATAMAKSRDWHKRTYREIGSSMVSFAC